MRFGIQIYCDSRKINKNKEHLIRVGQQRKGKRQAEYAQIVFIGNEALYIFRQAKTGGRLALFAMLIQLLFAFGHIDLPEHHGDSQIVLFAKTLLAFDGIDSAPLEKHHNQEKSSCPTCWMSSAAGTLIMPVMAMVWLLFGTFVSHPPIKTIGTAIIGFLWFRNERAPPLCPAN